VTRCKPAAYRGKKKAHEDVVAQRLARKPITFSFTENVTDPASFTLMRNKADLA
jgi:hypothetical protein